MQNWKANLTRRLLAALVAVTAVASLASYEFAHVQSRSGSAAAAPLDDNSVAAILTLDAPWKRWQRRVTPLL